MQSLPHDEFNYQCKIDRSAVKAELYPVRNVHQAFRHGLLAGLVFAGLSLVTRGSPNRAVFALCNSRFRRFSSLDTITRTSSRPSSVCPIVWTCTRVEASATARMYV